jgi:C_GCAxxG_C_C family probable redox protein
VFLETTVVSEHSREAPIHHQLEEIVWLTKERACNIFLTGQLLCTEAVFSVLNRGLGGGLPPDVAVRIASALPDGLGGSGCLCGALNGGALALGLFLGRNGPGVRNGSRVRSKTRMLHQLFVERFGSPCCRVLTKKVKYQSKSHFQQCSELTGAAAEMAARLILETRPEVSETADWSYLKERDSKLRGTLKKLWPKADTCFHQ